MLTETVEKVVSIMARYRVVVTGRGILVESNDQGDYFTGFVVCRFVKAASESEAVALVRRNLLIEWNHSFNRNRSSGVPRLSVELSARVNSPFKTSASSANYSFFSAENEVQTHLDQIISASSGWI